MKTSSFVSLCILVMTSQLFADRIHDLAHTGNMKEIQKLLAVSPELVNTIDPSESTPLHHAAEAGFKEVAALLLNKGANIDAESKSGITPLVCAISRNRTELAIFLLGKDAKTTAAYVDSSRNRGGYTAMHLAAHQVNAKVIKMLIDKSADVNALSDDEETPLFVALRDAPRYLVKEEDCRLVASILINAKAHATRANKNGVTALHLAVKSNFFDVAQLLIQAGADVNAESDDKMKPLSVALKNGDAKIIKLLKEKGATE